MAGSKPSEGYVAKATLSHVHVSPRKARLVVDTIRGKHVEEALELLENIPKKSAPMVKKLLLSAVANAAQNSEVDVDELFVKRAWVNEGRKLPRRLARAHGRATMIIKRYCTVTLVLDELGAGR